MPVMERGYPMDDGYTAARARQLAADGVSQRAIAAQLGISRHRVRSVLGGTRAPVNVREATGAIVGGRLSADRAGTGIGSFSAIMPHNEAENDLRMEWLDDATIRTMPIDKLMEVAANASPELSRGIWDFLIMCMPGHEITAYTPGTREIDERGQAIVNETNRLVQQLHGSQEVLFGQSFMSAAIRGAMALEIVFGEDSRTVADLVAFDPATVRFRQRRDPVRGTVWEKGQLISGEWVSLEVPTVRYIAIHRFPGKPYGRAPMTAAIFPALFLLGFFQDLRRVVANQGYPRLHMKVSLDGIYEMLTNGDRELEGDVDPETVTSILNAVVAQTREAFAGIQPHDNYITSSLIDIASPVGTLGAGALGSVTGIIEALERMCTKAMKTMPLMQGITDGVSEANANRQWEIHTQGIKAVQHYAENLYGPAYELICQAQGVIVDVEVRFAELRAAEALRDEQTLNMRVLNAKLMQDYGWKTPLEAAQYATGEVSAAVEASYDDPDGSARIDAGATAPVADEVEPEPGSNRAGAVTRAALLPVVPDTVPVTSVDERAAAALFDDLEPDYSGLLDSPVVEG